MILKEPQKYYVVYSTSMPGHTFVSLKWFKAKWTQKKFVEFITKTNRYSLEDVGSTTDDLIYELFKSA